MGIEIVGLLVIAAALVLFLLIRPSVTRDRGGRVLAFLGLFILPVLTVAVGFGAHIEKSKRTEFCESCHVMEPYAKSLMIDDNEFLPANHYQNNHVPREEACFTCHTTYALYGDVQAKMRGLRHLLVNYTGGAPDTIELYEPYNNRECLHCHSGARGFESADPHVETDTTMSALKANRLSCLTSNCHDLVHDVHNVGDYDMWKGVRE